jgi:hypothetical protein
MSTTTSWRGLGGASVSEISISSMATSDAYAFWVAQQTRDEQMG